MTAAFLADPYPFPPPHLDTRIKISFLLNAIVPKLEYAGEVRGGNAKFVKQV